MLLGDERLYRVSAEINQHELDKAKQVVNDLHDTIMAFRKRVGFGRAIAAPQIDEPYRIIHMNYDDQAIAFINPRLEFNNSQQFSLWDDCMSFPGLEVRLNRYKECTIHYKDLEWKDCKMEFSGDLAELIQHEYDHLDGILAVQRAIDSRSFRINKEKAL